MTRAELNERFSGRWRVRRAWWPVRLWALGAGAYVRPTWSWRWLVDVVEIKTRTARGHWRAYREDQAAAAEAGAT